jgi:phospholipid transport system substrate-binding protein
MENSLRLPAALGMVMVTVVAASLAPVAESLAKGSNSAVAKAPAAPAQSPSDVIRASIEQLLAALVAERDALDEHPERLYTLVDEMIVPHLDIERMARIVLGKHWRKASSGESRRFVEEFRGVLVRTYATSLQDYADQEIKILPQEGAADGQTTAVRVEIRSPGEPVIPLTFQVHNRNGSWMVYDLKVEGISLVANFRSEFSSLIRAEGLEALIARLAERNQETAVASR